MEQSGQRGVLLLRIAIAFAFLYPPLDSYFHPYSWISFFPPFMLGHVSDSMLLFGWGALEVVIAVWILSGKKIFIPSLAATLLLLVIVAFNTSMFEIVFRDISLALVAATLAWRSYNNNE